jgi:LacI family transcriptional regulator
VAADVVRCDSEGGAFELGRLLGGLGHRAVALLAGPEGVTTSDDRVASFRRGLAAAGPAAAAAVYHGPFTQASGEALTRLALAAAVAPTALFCANNFITIGALRALRDLGRRVPEDIALVGFDDLPEALVTFPFLTVAAQPAYEMGQRAVALLRERLAGLGPREFAEIVLPAELVVRASSGGPLTAAGDPTQGAEP